MTLRSFSKVLLLIFITIYYGCRSKVNCDDILYITTEGGKNCNYSLELGKCLHEKGDFKLALMNYLAFARNCDTTSYLMTDISDCYFKLNKETAAEKFALLALKFDSSNNNAKYNLAVIYFNRKEFKKASKIINETDVFEDDPEFCLLAFEVYWWNDEIDKARKFIEKAIELDNEEDEYKSRYAAFLGSIGRNEKAINIAQEIYKRTEDTSYYYFSMSRLLGILYIENGDTINGCKYFEKLKNRDEFKEIYFQEIQRCAK